MSNKCDLSSIEFSKADKIQFKNSYENLVFEGGGVKGIAFGGVIKCLADIKILENIKRFAGSSAGSVVAAALAIGYDYAKVVEILNDTDFNKFKDDSWGVVLDAYRFITEYGIYKGDALYNWIKKIIKEQTDDEDFTFQQVYDTYGKELVITGTCLNRAQTYYFHHSTHPNMPISLAVRISMSIPLVFKAIILNREEIVYDEDGNVLKDDKGEPIKEIHKDIMVDGGLLDNYPIWVFDGDRIGERKDIDDQAMTESKTLGFKLMSSNEKKDYQLYHTNEKINGIVDYLKSFINSMTIQIERGHIRSGYWDKTVCVNTFNITTMDFNMSEEDKEKLIESGYNSTKNHFYCQVQNIPNKWNEIFM